MGYTEKNLGRNEEIIQRGSTSMITLLSDVIWAVLIIIIFAALEKWYIGLIIAAIIVGVKYLKVKTTELSLTNKKVIGKLGIIATKVMDSPLNKINNISVEQGLGGKIFGYGTIVITTSSGSFNFKYISHPDIFRSSVMNQIDAYDEERIRKQAEQLASAVNSR